MRADRGAHRRRRDEPGWVLGRHPDGGARDDPRHGATGRGARHPDRVPHAGPVGRRPSRARGARRRARATRRRSRPRAGSLVDVMYRPCQVNSLDELRWLHRHGRRVLVNQLDAIAWSNPSYFPSERKWLEYRELTRLVLASVDGVAFISDFARREVAPKGCCPSTRPCESSTAGRRACSSTPTHRASGRAGSRRMTVRSCSCSARRTTTRTARSPAGCSVSCARAGGTDGSCSPARRRRTATRSPTRRPRSSSSASTVRSTPSPTSPRPRRTGSTPTPRCRCTRPCRRASASSRSSRRAGTSRS